MLVKDKTLVGNHLNVKLDRLGIKHPKPGKKYEGSDIVTAKRLIEISKVFNYKDDLNEKRLEDLCYTQLNINYKRGTPFSFAEAKVTIALYKVWEMLDSK